MYIRLINNKLSNLKKICIQMYSALDRENIRNIIIDSLVNENVDGIIQIGSGVQGYNDKYSDLVMMIAFNADLIDMKNKLKNIYTELGSFYI